jgi:cytoskeletal protein CcmA (bactofilin family)
MFKRANRDAQPSISGALTDQKPAPDAVESSAPQHDEAVLDAPDQYETLIGEGSRFEGTYRSEESIRIRGSMHGEVASKRSIFVEAQARVTARVIGMEVTVAGQIDGQIACDGRVELMPTARVTGEITAGTLIMQDGAVFEGQLKMASRSGEVSPIAVTTERSGKRGRLGVPKRS